MEVVLEKAALKELKKLNEPIKSRIKRALLDLEYDPPRGDIVKLVGEFGFRRRVGGYRILFDVTDYEVVVYKIAPRSGVYKD